MTYDSYGKSTSAVDHIEDGTTFTISDKTKKARFGKYVVYDVDFLLDHLADEVHLLMASRELASKKKGKIGDISSWTD